VGILELMAKPKASNAPEARAGDAPQLEITGRAAAASSDPVLDQYRRRLSMTVLS
jgi:putative thioredoxin